MISPVSHPAICCTTYHLIWDTDSKGSETVLSLRFDLLPHRLATSVGMAPKNETINDSSDAE